MCRTTDGRLDVLLVHRPRYDDWSFPKGKLESGESWEEAALREVEEEAGLRCRIVRSVGDMDYQDGSGRSKRVRYFVMEAADDGIAHPDHEVDEVAWLPFDEAVATLSYDRDRALLRDFERS